MAVNIGEAFGRSFGSSFQEGSRDRGIAEMGGSFFDMGMSLNQQMQDEAIARDQMAFQQRLAAEYTAMAQARAQSELQAQQRLLDRTSKLDLEIKRASAKLGEYNMVNKGDIEKNYQDIRENYMSGYMDVVERVTSQETAANIAKGVGSSTYNSDRQADIIEKSVDKIAELDQMAFDSAINRTKSYVDTLNTGRASALDEVKGVYNTAIGAESPLLTNYAPQMLQQSFTNQGDFTRSAMETPADSQETFGAAVGSFGEQIAPNVGYNLGLTENRTNVLSEQDRELEYYRTASLGAGVPKYKGIAK